MKVGVIGLGCFGYSIATTLTAKGIEVLAVDSNESIISSIKDFVTQAVCINITDEESLKSVGVDLMDLVIVATGENFAQSILITALLKKRLNIPHVITRSMNQIHTEIIKLIGADETIIPEEEIGIRLAEQISSPFNKFFRITKNFSLSQIKAPESFEGQILSDLSLYDSYKIRCIGLKKDDDIITIDSSYKVQKDDMLLFAGHEKDLKKIAKIN